jgi:tRNA(fMet)-specific endonuclease VapC
VEQVTGKHKDWRRLYLSTVLQSVPIIPYTEETAYEHARIWAELEASGKMISYYDLIVGATALERGSQIATFNRRHFSQISGLRVIDPK